MTLVPTFAGDIDVNALGRTLMHEHIFVSSPELQQAWPGFMGWDEDEAMAQARAKLLAIKASGIDTIVDMTVPGLGRNVSRAARAVEGTGLQVLAVTGYYTFGDLPFPFRHNGKGKTFNNDDADSFLVDLFVRDVLEGIEGTGIKAAAIKCVTDGRGVTPDVERLIRAAAAAHLRTDAPIVTHTHAKTRRGLDQQRILAEEGVDLTRVLIGHSNESDDIDYLLALMDNGSYVGFDRCGIGSTTPLDSQKEMLVELCRRGYAGQIALSHDAICATDWFPLDEMARIMPTWHHGYIHQSLIPELLASGVTDAQIDQMMIHTPRAFFAARSERSADVAV